MNDLVTFLRARLDEDEAAAKAAIEESAAQWQADDQWLVYKDRDGIDRAGILNEITDFDAIAHIARHDPARVLREVEAGRKILAEYDARDRDTELMLGPDTLRQREWSGLRVAVRLLASVYSDHRDYRPEWSATP